MKQVGVLLALLAFLGLGACRSPSHQRELGSNTIRLYSNPPVFAGREEVILDAIATTLKRAAALIELRNVSIDVAIDSRRAIPGYGVGGYTPSAERVLIWLDPESSETPGLLSRRLPWIVAHEVHHAARWRGPGYGTSLLQAMVSEGLADHFALQLLGGPAVPWTSALSSEQRAGVRARATLTMAERRYDHAEWFFGSGSIPRWAGYTLGFEMVSVYLDSNPGSNAAAAVGVAAEAFRPSWACDGCEGSE